MIIQSQNPWRKYQARSLDSARVRFSVTAINKQFFNSG